MKFRNPKAFYGLVKNPVSHLYSSTAGQSGLKAHSAVMPMNSLSGSESKVNWHIPCIIYSVSIGICGSNPLFQKPQAVFCTAIAFAVVFEKSNFALNVHRPKNFRRCPKNSSVLKRWR
jgi:hypothetical protein